jgi:choline-sulfatase
MLMMPRRQALIGAAILALGAGVWWYAAGPRPTRDRARQSADGPIVFISIDTLRADRLPAYGSTGAKTPNIDSLVADAVLFENAYAHAPQTLPSHVSILSGELPFEHGVRDNIGFSVKSGQRFLQHTLKDAGYATAAFVSSYVLRRQTGFNQGFDTFDDDLPPASPEEPLAQVQRGGERTVAAAITWIDAAPSSKFFLFAHIYEPHTPYQPPARFANRDPYDGEVEYSDEIVGRLIEHLRAKDLYEPATIVLFSDHGEGLGDHGEDEHGVFLYRATTHVPLIVKMPGSTGAGRRVAAPVQHIDLVPTIVDAAGLWVRDSNNQSQDAGRSLLPLLTATGTIEAANIYSESLTPRYHYGWSELYSLSDERYRLIRAPKDELYDLAQDPGERDSIASDRPQVRTAMRGTLDAIITEARVTAPSGVSDDDRQKLAALGYVGTQSATNLELPADQLPDPKDKTEVLRRYKRALRLAAEGNNTAAVSLFRDVLKTDPGMTDAWLQLAGAQTQQGRFEDALAAYKKVITSDPSNAAALTGATSALLRLGRIDDARAHADLATGVAPAVAHETLARIAVYQKDDDTARRHAQLAQQADPTLPMTDFIEGMILHGHGRYADAASRLLAVRQKMSTRTEQLADLNYLAADCLARLERYAEAEQLFKAELALFPTHVRARGGLAMLYKASGRDAEAERAIAELVQAAPTREGIDMAAQLWTAFGEPRRAAAVRAKLRREQRD